MNIFNVVTSQAGLPRKSVVARIRDRFRGGRVAVPTLALSVVAGAMAVNGGFTTPSAAASTTEATFPLSAGSSSLGVLDADTALLDRDQAARVKFATLDLNWSQWEPGNGQFNFNYITTDAADAAVYRQNGWKIAVDLGLDHAPAWALNLTNGHLVDQHGRKSATADFEFSAPVRKAAASYIHRVVAALGAVQFYRVGLSENGEAYYPDVTGGGWWSSGPAQDSADHLPEGVGSTPLRGWVPGSATYDGHPITASKVSAWYNWYFGAMVNAHEWEISTLRQLGYSGYIELVMPGDGAMPARYNQLLAENLETDTRVDPTSTMNTGAVWWKFLAALKPLTNTVVDVSSVYDQSGTPRGNGCGATDASVNYLTNPEIYAWSSTRWLTYLASQHGLSVMGENSDQAAASQVASVVSLARSCHLRSFQWAQDHTLNGHAEVTVAQLQSEWS